MAIINRLQGTSVTNLMYLWIVFAESIFSYGSFIFALESMTAEVTEAYARIYMKNLKYVMGVRQNTPNILAYLPAGGARSLRHSKDSRSTNPTLN